MSQGLATQPVACGRGFSVSLRPQADKPSKLRLSSVLTPWITQLLGLDDGDANTERVASAYALDRLFRLEPAYLRQLFLMLEIQDQGKSFGF